MAAHAALYILSSAASPLLVLTLLVSPSPLATHPGIYNCIVDAHLVVGSTLAGTGVICRTRHCCCPALLTAALTMLLAASSEGIPSNLSFLSTANQLL
ncbi:hypothetical protein CPB84DRAFT_1858038 [Gymnopilus junonius]|uniref:Secreted protein n=1 Tax=Gymnopilus junonius TaxID=109634 RepID=A0A9P5N7L7_GYMJU|nr:hypothetical protein CPB84DRAFT_1858038 [Gymnopilus junonius]